MDFQDTLLVLAMGLHVLEIEIAGTRLPSS